MSAIPRLHRGSLKPTAAETRLICPSSPGRMYFAAARKWPSLRRWVPVCTTEFLQDEVRNEHRHTGLIQLVQKAHAIEEDDRRRVDDTPRAHSVACPARVDPSAAPGPINKGPGVVFLTF